jgi:hypothetical protein
MIAKKGEKVLNEKYADLPPRLSACGRWLFQHYHLTTMSRTGGLVQEQGVNDGDYQAFPRINGVMYTCAIYKIWASMLERTQIGGVYQQKYPTYAGTEVAKEWLSFLAFKNWLEGVNIQFRKELNIAADDPTSVWTGRQLDKDLLADGSKLYSPDTCLFVTSNVNSFVLDGGGARGDSDIGVSFHKSTGKYQVNCNNQGRQEYLGLFTHDQLDLAAYTYQKRKHELAYQLAEQLSLSPFSHDRIAAECLRKLYPLPTLPTK